jgi:hypothetical protein
MADEIRIYNTSCMMVSSIDVTPKSKLVYFNGRDSSGRYLPSGLYIYTLMNISRRMVLIK